MENCSKLLAIILSGKFVYPCGKQLKGMSRLKSVLPYCYQTKLGFSGFVRNNVNLLTWNCEGKNRVCCRCQYRVWATDGKKKKKKKTLSFLMGFREVFLWVKWGTGRQGGWLACAQLFDWLMVRIPVIRVVSQELTSSGSSQSEGYVLTDIIQLASSIGGVFSICKTTRECAWDNVIHVLQGGTKDSVTAIQLIYCLNCYQFSWLNCYFSHYMFTYF